MRDLVGLMAGILVHLVNRIELLIGYVVGRLEVFDARVLVGAEEKRLFVKGG